MFRLGLGAAALVIAVSSLASAAPPLTAASFQSAPGQMSGYKHTAASQRAFASSVYTRMWNQREAVQHTLATKQAELTRLRANAPYAHDSINRLVNEINDIKTRRLNSGP